MAFRRVNVNTPVDQWQTVTVGKVVHHISGFRVIDTTYDQIGVSSTAISSLIAYGQRNAPNNKPRRSRDPANVGSGKIHLAKAYRKTVSIDKPVKIVQGNLIRIDDCNVFDARSSERLENHATNASNTHYADMGAGKALLSG